MSFDAFDCLPFIQGPIRASSEEDQQRPGPTDDYWYVPVAGGGGVSSSGMWVSSDTALTIATVFACIRVLSEGVASLPLNIYERLPNNKGKRIAYEHPLFNLLKYQPNERQTAIQFWETAMAHLLLRGRFLAVIQPGMNGPFGQLIPLNPDRVAVVELNSGRFRYDYRDEQGRETKYLEDELFRVEGLSLDAKRPVSILRYARETMGLALSAQSYGSRFFQNNARPSGVLQHPGKLSDPGRHSIRKSWQDAFGGVSNAAKTALLEEGMTYQSISLTMEDAQFLETRKFQRDDICAIFRVQPHKVMNLERSTNNNIEHQGIEHVQDTLRPWLVRNEQSIGRDLILDRERYFAEFLADALLRGDNKSRADYFSKALGSGGTRGWLTQNEVRAMENKNPLPGGDELPQPTNTPEPEKKPGQSKPDPEDDDEKSDDDESDKDSRDA